MKYNILGNTGLFVSELCFGTMTFGAKGRFKAVGGVDQKGADALMKQVIESGVNFIDTANVYSEGLSEEITGKAIKNAGFHVSHLFLPLKCGVLWVTAAMKKV